LHELADEYGISAERVRQVEVERHQQAQGIDGGRLTADRRPSTRQQCVRVAIRSHVERAGVRHGMGVAT